MIAKIYNPVKTVFPPQIVDLVFVPTATFVRSPLAEVALQTTIVLLAKFVKVVFASTKTAINAQQLLSAHPISVAAAVFASAIQA